MMSKVLANLKRHAIRVLLSLVILSVFVFHVMEYKISGLDLVLDKLELQLYDLRLGWQLQTNPLPTPDPRVVIIEIDEHSLQELGRWPWNRQIMATMLDNLFDYYEVHIAGFDIIFADPDTSSGFNVLKKLGENELKENTDFLEKLDSLKRKLDYDALFVEKMTDRRVILGYSLINDIHQNENTGVLPQPVLSEQEAEPLQLHRALTQATSYVSNLMPFAEKATATGHFDIHPDSDGVIRRAALLRQYEGKWYEALSLSVLRVLLSEPFIEVNPNRIQQLGYRNIAIGDKVVPIDRHAQALIPFIGPYRSYPYVSATDIVHKRADKALLKNKIVLLGATAQGLLDMRVTPVEKIYPGVEIHANLITGILDQRVMINPEYLRHIEVALLVITGLIMITLLPLFSPFYALLGSLGLLLTLIWLDLFLWSNLQVVLPIASILAMMLAQFLFNMSYGYFVESRNKRELAGLFGQYIPPELVAEMDKNPSTQHFSMEGESREMTVLFTDVRGFTTISEGLSPKALSTLMNAFLTPMTKIIHENRGTIDKYMGDAIMAFWGAPLPEQNHARLALDAGMQMVARLEALQPEFRAKGWPLIKIGVGLNTGMMSVGNMGSEFRMAYTVLGDAVNLGSRLEGLTKQYGVTLIVSESTRAAVPEYVYRELDRVRVKGKDKPISIYQPLGLRDDIDPTLFNELTLYEQALNNYRGQAWQTTYAQFTELRQQYPDNLIYRIYLERTEHFLNNPPDKDWDGVYTFTTK